MRGPTELIKKTGLDCARACSFQQRMNIHLNIIDSNIWEGSAVNALQRIVQLFSCEQGRKKIPCRLGTGLKAHRCDESGRVKHCQRGTLKQRVQCREGQNPCLYRVSRYCVTVCNQECVSEICVGMAELRKYPITGAGHLACAMSGNCRDWPWFPGTFWRRMRRPRSRLLPFSKSPPDGNPTALPRPA